MRAGLIDEHEAAGRYRFCPPALGHPAARKVFGPRSCVPVMSE
jgi:hypothetical protein